MEYVRIQIVDLVVKAEIKVQMKVHVAFHVHMTGGVILHLMVLNDVEMHS
tara:strand:- start:72 stop:221 length:150 start_codon:yes stop_codon:yes gene_type:complete